MRACRRAGAATTARLVTDTGARAPPALAAGPARARTQADRPAAPGPRQAHHAAAAQPAGPADPRRRDRARREPRGGAARVPAARHASRPRVARRRAPDGVGARPRRRLRPRPADHTTRRDPQHHRAGHQPRRLQPQPRSGPSTSAPRWLASISPHRSTGCSDRRPRLHGRPARRWFAWHLNPSTRPGAAAPESWTVTCERPPEQCSRAPASSSAAASARRWTSARCASPCGGERAPGVARAAARAAHTRALHPALHGQGRPQHRRRDRATAEPHARRKARRGRARQRGSRLQGPQPLQPALPERRTKQAARAAAPRVAGDRDGALRDDRSADRPSPAALVRGGKTRFWQIRGTSW